MELPVLRRTLMLSVLVASMVLAGCQTGPQSLAPVKRSTDSVAADDISQSVAQVKDQKPTYAAGAGPENVLLVINSASEESREIGAYYRVKRAIPKENVVMVNISRTENMDETEFNIGLKNPIKAAIQQIRSPINYIVLTTGIPIRIGDNNGFSVDGRLAVMNSSVKPIGELTQTEVDRNKNPYFGANTPFSSAKYNMYLVTRLTGYTTADAKKLVDRSLSASENKGPFFFDLADNRKSGSYGQLEELMKRAAANLKQKGFDSQIDETAEYVLPGQPLMGYITWGSNDGAFDPGKYGKVQFQPGAICETFVSTSARTFQPTQGGQSLIADLIKSGVTGIKGYVSEPYTFALAHPDILFDRYTSGFNLAESFYSASPVVNWKDLVVGDPLCRPYPIQRASR